MVSSLVIGIIFLVLGLALRYWINRRKFYRRGPMGAEGFSSYESSVKSSVSSVGNCLIASVGNSVRIRSCKYYAILSQPLIKRKQTSVTLLPDPALILFSMFLLIVVMRQKLF